MNAWRQRWRSLPTTLVAAALLAAAHALAQTPVIDIYNIGNPSTMTNAGNYEIVGNLAKLYLNVGVANYNDWGESCTQVKLYDIYSVTNPVYASQYPSGSWGMNVVSGSATNLWDITFTAYDFYEYIGPGGDTRIFTLGTFIPTNAVGELLIGERRGQGNLQSHGWRPGTTNGSLDRTGGDEYLGPVGLLGTALAVVEALTVPAAGGSVGLTVRLRPLTTNAVDYSATLAPGSWSNLVEVVNGSTSEVRTNLDGLYAPGSNAFYRVHSWRAGEVVPAAAPATASETKTKKKR